MAAAPAAAAPAAAVHRHLRATRARCVVRRVDRSSTAESAAGRTLVLRAFVVVVVTGVVEKTDDVAADACDRALVAVATAVEPESGCP